MLSGAGNVGRGSRVLNTPCWAVQCQDEQQQDSPARKAAGFQDQWETGHWVCFLLPGGQCQTAQRMTGRLPSTMSFGHILPFQAHPSTLHSISHALVCPGARAVWQGLCASPVWAQTGEEMDRVAGKGDTRVQAVSHTAGCAPCACWPWRRGPWPRVLSLDPRGSGSAQRVDKSLAAQTLALSREAAVPLTLAQAGTASPHPPHQNHKFAVGLPCSPPILGCQLP